MRSQPLQLILGFVLLAVLGVAGWLLASWVVRALLGLDKALASALIAGLVAVFTAVFAYWRERAKSRQESHREKKVEVYTVFFDLIFRIVRDSKRPGGVDSYLASDEFQEHMFSLMKGVLAYGSPEVIRAISRWRVESGSTKDAEPIKRIGDVLLAMRKDLGLSNAGLTNINIHQVYVNEDINIALRGNADEHP
ncbi:MAG: hypothetical protein K0M55_10795 [Rhizobium sp.]|nr:hypothetical protein [Rhizobium sp.]